MATFQVTLPCKAGQMFVIHTIFFFNFWEMGIRWVVGGGSRIGRYTSPPTHYSGQLMSVALQSYPYAGYMIIKKMYIDQHKKLNLKKKPHTQKKHAIYM